METKCLVADSECSDVDSGRLETSVLGIDLGLEGIEAGFCVKDVGFDGLDGGKLCFYLDAGRTYLGMRW